MAMSSATPMFWLLTGIYLAANIPFKLAAVISGRCGRSDAESPSIDPDPDYFGAIADAVRGILAEESKDGGFLHGSIGGQTKHPMCQSMAITQLFTKGQLSQEPSITQKIEKAESRWKSTKFGQQ
jgi:hypothetical protein